MRRRAGQRRDWLAYIAPKEGPQIWDGGVCCLPHCLSLLLRHEQAAASFSHDTCALPYLSYFCRLLQHCCSHCGDTACMAIEVSTVPAQSAYLHASIACGPGTLLQSAHRGRAPSCSVCSLRQVGAGVYPCKSTAMQLAGR
jgi:hypothetical protein